MATHPDANPDSIPAGRPDDIEQVSPAPSPVRESVEDMPGRDRRTDDRGAP